MSRKLLWECLDRDVVASARNSPIQLFPSFGLARRSTSDVLLASRAHFAEDIVRGIRIEMIEHQERLFQATAARVQPERMPRPTAVLVQARSDPVIELARPDCTSSTSGVAEYSNTGNSNLA